MYAGPNGWLSTEGEFFQCGHGWHGDLAEWLLKRPGATRPPLEGYGPGYGCGGAEDELEKLGYWKLSMERTDDAHPWLGLFNATDAQWKHIKQWARDWKIAAPRFRNGLLESPPKE